MQGKCPHCYTTVPVLSYTTCLMLLRALLFPFSFCLGSYLVVLKTYSLLSLRGHAGKCSGDHSVFGMEFRPPTGQVLNSFSGPRLKVFVLDRQTSKREYWIKTFLFIQSCDWFSCVASWPGHSRQGTTKLHEWGKGGSFRSTQITQHRRTGERKMWRTSQTTAHPQETPAPKKAHRRAFECQSLMVNIHSSSHERHCPRKWTNSRSKGNFQNNKKEKS